jgi:restriction system protein
MAVQVKRWRRSVQAPIVQQVRSSLGAHKQGWLVAWRGICTDAPMSCF